MKKFALAALAFALMTGLSACKDKNNEETAEVAQNDTVPQVFTADFGEGFSSSINIRYIDQTKLSSEYNLAKDLQDLIVKNESELQRYHQAKMNEIQTLASQIEEKYRNNGYMTQVSFEQDQKKLQQLQQSAEAGMAKKQQEYQQQVEQMTYNIQVNLQNFLIEYNKEHHYDAILYQSAGAYFNPALDITDEVVEGLNKIYNQYREE